MNDLNEQLRAGLSADDEAFLKDLEDGQGLFAQISATLTGPMRFWVAVGITVAFIATGLGLWAVWNLFQADTTRGQILWAGGAWAAWTMQVNLKQWLYNRMNTLTILREIKKMEWRLLNARTD